jgi:hypothetical protein
VGLYRAAELGRVYAGIKAVEGGVGRLAIAPETLFALWLYATLEGVPESVTAIPADAPNPSIASPKWQFV